MSRRNESISYFAFVTSRPLYLVSCILLFITCTFSKECDKVSDSSKRYIPRVFVATYEGPNAILADEASAAMNLGSCRTTAEHAAEMVKAFEAFGADLEPVRDNPYKSYDGAQFSITPYVLNPETMSAIRLNSFFEYAQVTSTPLLFTSWALVAKTDLKGQDKRLPSGYWVFYGMIR